MCPMVFSLRFFLHLFYVKFGKNFENHIRYLKKLNVIAQYSFFMDIERLYYAANGTGNAQGYFFAFLGEQHGDGDYMLGRLYR